MDKSEINKRLVYISKKLEKLKISINKHDNIASNEEDKYIIMRAIERDCEEIIESAIRINQEILEDIEIIGETYRDSFEQLINIKIFTKEEIEKLANLVGFRNRLAYEYLDLNEEITKKSAKNILKYYPSYLLKIQDYIDSKS